MAGEKARMYRGKVFDVGHAWAEIRSAIEGSYVGVEIHPTDTRVMSPNECRRMATFLLLAADWCEKRNKGRRIR
jgi:hypothetical protein